MNIQRLKFAWARGARIDLVDADGEAWLKATYQAPVYDGDSIHPDDAHLEYGPLSSAVRDLALYGWPAWSTATLFDRTALQALVIELSLEKDDPTYTPVEWDFFSLFFAEYLADEGL